MKKQITSESAHTFHIPVMGTSFTIDSPLKIAKFGISSVLSLVDDVLMEQMRKYHSEEAGLPYEDISGRDADSRAHRITAYMNLLGERVNAQVQELKNSVFEAGSLITRYYEMLPESPLKKLYHTMLSTDDPAEKARLQQELRDNVVPGSIDVNIMTKMDPDKYHHGEKVPPEETDAMTALRGFAESDVSSSVVFSAGLNMKLYTYASQFADFFPNALGEIKKQIVLKVSDYRSALTQGKFLAKRGLWVSEYRIESGLNCGGHAFANKGLLLGTILDEFNKNRQKLIETVKPLYDRTLKAMGLEAPESTNQVKITVQGGIGTAEEDQMLRNYYQVEATGWGTPFMLVPEAVTIDDEHLRKLAEATEKDVHPSDNSPLGVKFWSLRTSASEEARRERIREGHPGTACPKGFAKFNSEFTNMPICVASQAYQKLKLKELDGREDLTDAQRSVLKTEVMERACICHDLAGAGTVSYGIDPKATPAVCCGPNIVNFNRMASLEEMVDHIYGRGSLLSNPERPHMFIAELKLYIDNLREELELAALDLSSRSQSYFEEFVRNLQDGISYYRQIADEAITEKKQQFLDDLDRLGREIEALELVPTV